MKVIDHWPGGDDESISDGSVNLFVAWLMWYQPCFSSSRSSSATNLWPSMCVWVCRGDSEDSGHQTAWGSSSLAWRGSSPANQKPGFPCSDERNILQQKWPLKGDNEKAGRTSGSLYWQILMVTRHFLLRVPVGRSHFLWQWPEGWPVELANVKMVVPSCPRGLQ